MERELLQGGPPTQLQTWLRLSRPDGASPLRAVALTVLVTWGVPALLTLLPVGGGVRLFLRDFAVHARFLLAAPLLMLGYSLCGPALDAVARQFMRSGLVAEHDGPRFAAAAISTHRLLDALWTEVAVILVAYGLVAILVFSVSPERVPSWQISARGALAPFSVAGAWHVFVSVPILLVLILGWIWRLLLWMRFLCLVARLDLRLLPSHPDHACGLAFVGFSVRVWAWLAFSLGVIVAGALANRVVNEGASLVDFRFQVLGFAIFVAVLFLSPPLVFVRSIVRTWRRGVLSYGALASTVGYTFEKKWLAPTGPRAENPFEANDFSTMTDLYQVVANVYAVRFLPMDLKSIIALPVAALLPLVPLAVIAIPIGVIIKTVEALLL